MRAKRTPRSLLALSFVGEGGHKTDSNDTEHYKKS